MTEAKHYEGAILSHLPPNLSSNSKAVILFLCSFFSFLFLIATEKKIGGHVQASKFDDNIFYASCCLSIYDNIIPLLQKKIAKCVGQLPQLQPTPFHFQFYLHSPFKLVKITKCRTVKYNAAGECYSFIYDVKLEINQ